MKSLDNLRWVPRWVSHLGCVKGCLDYLNMDVSDAWLFGATGHAFVINVHGVLCPSGPTAWNTEMLTQLGKNVGYESDMVFATKTADDFAEKQRLAWERVKGAIDAGVPCYGWELEIPEYYVIQGYDNEGYYFSGPGCDEGKGPKPWQELGESEIGIVEVYSVKPGWASGDAQAVKEALAFALEHAAGPDKWILPGYSSGLAGYDTWIRALEGGTADGFGTAFNAGVWSECRGYAVQFLKEAQERLKDGVADLFDEAIGRYQVVAEGLRTVAKMFPFIGMEPEHIKDEARVSAALEALRTARDAEAGGLEALQRIVDAL